MVYIHFGQPLLGVSSGNIRALNGPSVVRPTEHFNSQASLGRPCALRAGLGMV